MNMQQFAYAAVALATQTAAVMSEIQEAFAEKVVELRQARLDAGLAELSMDMALNQAFCALEAAAEASGRIDDADELVVDAPPPDNQEFGASVFEPSLQLWSGIPGEEVENV